MNSNISFYVPLSSLPLIIVSVRREPAIVFPKTDNADATASGGKFTEGIFNSVMRFDLLRRV